MLPIGCVILTIWGGLHLRASPLSLAASICGDYAPVMRMVFTGREIAAYDPRICAVTKSLAIMYNSGAAAFGLIVILLTWRGMVARRAWAFWAIAALGLSAQGVWLLAGSYIGWPTITGSTVFTALFLAGMVVAAIGMCRE